MSLYTAIAARSARGRSRVLDKAVDVAIIGGGAVGCSVAYHAASRGARVVLFETEEIGSGSSGALAGMLSGQSEAEKPGPLRDLLVQGREYHKTFAKALYETTELDPGYVWDGPREPPPMRPPKRNCLRSTPGTRRRTSRRNG